MKEQQLKKLIKKYLEGTATGAERYLVDNWLESFQMDQTQTDKQPNVEALAERIIAGAIKPKKRPSFLLWHKLTAAAAVLVCFALGALYYKDHKGKSQHLEEKAFHQYSTGTNQLKSIQLPDSSIVYLNANSSIEVRKAFNSFKERQVILRGEAFFEVKKDASRPFKIKIGDLQVRVLGTSFNIKAYNQNADVKISVKTGKVAVKKHLEVLSVLTRNQELIYHKSAKTFRTISKTVNADAQWREGTTILDQATFDELGTALYNTYGIRLQSKDEDVLTKRYNFTMRSSRNKEHTLTQLCELINKKYRKEGDLIIIY